jgi:tRNA dimethylallyltransferase
LEVIFLTGQRFSDLRDKNPSDFEFILIGLIRPRDELYRRVDQRIDFMFDRGLIQEVEELLNKGYDENLSSLSAIGYRETINVIHGECSIDNAKVIMKRKTRQFIRRQANWFKPDDPQILWFEMIPDPLEQIVSEINNRFTDTSTHA